MAVAPTGSGIRDDGVEKASVEPVLSPADERKKMLEDLMVQSAQGKREELSQSLLKEVAEKGPNEKAKIELLDSVLDKQELERINREMTALKTDPEEVNESKAEALHFLREATPYLFAVLALRYKLAADSPIASFLALGDKATDPEEKALLDGLVFLKAHPELETARYFAASLEADIMKDTKVLATAAKDALDALKDPDAKTWMAETMKAHPVATGVGLLLGSFAVFEAGSWLYHKVSGTGAETKAASSPDQPGVFSRLTSGWSFLTKAAISTAAFGGGLFVAGRVLGNDQVEKYLREHHMSALYDYRLTAALIQFCQGNIEEGLATWNYGPRDAETRHRHEVYSTQFGVSDQSVWVMAGINYKTMLEADPTREFPLATGFFSKIPYLADWFKLPDQVKSENAVIALLKAHDEEIQKQIPDANSLSLDEVLKKAFELNIFTASEAADVKTYSPELKTLIDEKESDMKGFRANMKELGEKTELSQGDLDALRKAEKEVGEGLDEVRLATPTYWTDFVDAIALTFPGLVVDQDRVNDADMTKAKDFYKSFAEKSSESDLDALGKDVIELKKISDFTSHLDTTKPLSAADHALLLQYTEALARMNDSVQRSVIQVKAVQQRQIADDESRKGFEEFMSDTKDFFKIYAYGYGGIAYGLYWSVENAVGENKDVSHRAIGVAATVGLLPMAANTGYAAYLIRNGEVAAGTARLLFPPISYLDLRTYYYSFLKDPAMLMEAVMKGKIAPDKAERLCTLALTNEHMIPEKTALIGQTWAHRMEQFQTLKDVLKNKVKLEWLERQITGVETFDRTAPHIEEWKLALVELIEKRTGMSFTEYVLKVGRERGSAKILIEALDKTPFNIAARMVTFFEEASKRFGSLPIPKPIVEKLFEKGGAGLATLKYFSTNAVRFGMTPAMACLATYYVCKDTYDARDKSERIALFALSIAVSEGVFRGVRAMELAPKHPLIMGAVALLAAFGVSTTAENLVEPYLKNPNLLSTGVRGIAAPILYTAGAGQLVDTVGHYYNATATTEKEYFMREIYLPLLGSKKMAFRDGDVGYFNEMSPEDAIEVWNYQVREKISALEKEGKDAHAAEIRDLKVKIIDSQWISRQVAVVEAKKVEIAQRGSTLNEEIQDKFGPSMTPVERRLVESILVLDVPESWMDESFMDIEKEARFALVRKFAHALDKDAELDTFVERKREIYSDIEFYRLLKLDQKVMQPTQAAKLAALLGVDPKYASQADDLYERVMGTKDPIDLESEESAQTEA